MLVTKSAQAYTQADFAAFDGVNIGTNSYTLSSDITATYTGNNTIKLTGYAPIVTPWFGTSWTTYNYVTIGIKLPAGFSGNTTVYQTGIMRYDVNPAGAYKMSTIGDGTTSLATAGAAVGYLDYSFAANSTNTKKDGLVKLQVIWNVGDAPEYFTIDINSLQASPVFIDKNANGIFDFDSVDLSFNTIQAAITAAAPGDTINVAAGTYDLTSRIDVNKAVSIIGDIATPANVVINAPVAGTQHGQNSVFMITSNDVTIQGFRIQGALHTGAAQNAGIYVDDPRLVANPGLSKITISNNELTNNGWGIFVHNIKNSTIANNKVYGNKSTATVGMEYDAGSGIVVYGRAQDDNHTYNLTIEDNEVYSNETDGVRIDVGFSSGDSEALSDDLAITIDDNTIYNNGRTIGTADKYIGIKSAGFSKGVTVSDNKIYGHAMSAAPSASNQSAGIWIAASNDWEINNNNIHNNTNGIYFLASTAVAGSGSHIIINNDIHANVRGISIDDGTEAVANNKNSIYSNNSTDFSGIGFTPYGVFNRGSDTFDTTNNWWGEATGPLNTTTNPSGLGNSVSSFVDYKPWFIDVGLDTLSNAALASVNLGSAASYGVLSNTYTNTSAATRINGDVGFTSGPVSVAGTHTNYGSAGSYSAAGTAQATALDSLNSQACTFTFTPGAVVLATNVQHGSSTYTSGVYCIDGAVSVGAGITLSGVGTYTFRSTGALDAEGSSIVTLNGASANDVFWTPNGATTLNAGATFIGTVIPVSQPITVLDNVSWIGRALTFGSTVTTGATDTITVPGVVDTFTLTYSAGANGSIVGSSLQTVDYNTSGTEVTATPAVGYHFVAWSDNGALPATRTDANVVANLSTTASFAVNSYTLTFISGGSEVAPITQAYLSAVVAPVAPTKSDYTFSGWSPVVPATMPLGGDTLTATWTPISQHHSTSSSSPRTTIVEVNTPIVITPVPAGKVLGAEAYNFTLLIKNNSKGNEVIELQKYLIANGYLTGIADGSFGPKTLEGVKKFQNANSLVADGIVGPAARAILNKALVTPATPAIPADGNGTPATPATPATYNFGTTNLKNGSHGDAVQELQRFLNNILGLELVVDGKLGPKTIAVIKQWQGDNGLIADGIIGVKTKALMNSQVK